MLSKRKLLIIALVLVGVAAFIAAIFAAGKSNAPGPAGLRSPTPSLVAVGSPPKTIEFPPIPAGAKFVYSGKRKDVPSSMPLYRYTETPSPTSLNKLADSLSGQFGLQSTPSATIEGQSFMYTRNDQYRSFALSKTKDIVSVTYQRILVKDGTMVLQEDSQNGAASFFAPLLSLSPGVLFYALPGGMRSFEGVVILERPIPPLKNYLFGISIQNIPILTKEYTRRWASLTVDNMGAVRILNFVASPAVSPFSNTSIIPLELAVQNLNEGNGVILWITQESGEQYGVAPSFTRGALTDFSLVYIHRGGILLPAFLFTGEGVSPSGVKQIFETLVLAVPTQK